MRSPRSIKATDVMCVPLLFWEKIGSQRLKKIGLSGLELANSSEQQRKWHVQAHQGLFCLFFGLRRLVFNVLQL